MDIAKEREDYKETSKLMIEATRQTLEKRERLATVVSNIEVINPLRIDFVADDGEHVGWIESGNSVIIDSKQQKLNF